MNRKGIIRTVLLLLIISSIPLPVYASDDDNDDVIEFFYEIGCKKCEKIRPIVEDVASEHNLSVVEYEITDRSGFERMDKYGIRVVPAVVISGQVVLHSDYGGNLTLLADPCLQICSIRTYEIFQPCKIKRRPEIRQTRQTKQVKQVKQVR